MKTNPESAAVEAVAWVERTEAGLTRMWSTDLSAWATRPANPEPLYSQATVDALRGEVERKSIEIDRLMDKWAAEIRRADAAERRLAEVREIQRSNYGNGVGLHLEMILWAREYDALTKESP